VPEEKFLRRCQKNISNGTDTRCACRKTVPEIGGKDWKGLLADSSEVIRWNNQLVDDRSLN